MISRKYLPALAPLVILFMLFLAGSQAAHADQYYAQEYSNTIIDGEPSGSALDLYSSSETNPYWCEQTCSAYGDLTCNMYSYDWAYVEQDEVDGNSGTECIGYTQSLSPTAWGPYSDYENAGAGAYYEEYDQAWTYVNPAPTPAVQVYASPSSIYSGQGTLITWTSQNTSWCWGYGGSGSTSGTYYDTPTTTTTYTVVCGGDDGSYPWSSATVTVTPPPQPPPAPAYITASCSLSGNSVSLSWPSSAGATNYAPRIGASPGTNTTCTANGWQIYTDNSTCYPNPDNWSTTSVNNFSVNPGQTYSAWVSATNANGWSATSAYTTFTCAAPSCPVGDTGTYPNCVAPSCPTGDTGTYPNCVAPPPTPPSVSCSVSNSSPQTGQAVTYTASPANGATGPYTWMPSNSSMCTSSSGSTESCTYSAPGSYAMSVNAANTSSTPCSPSQVTVTGGYCSGGSANLSITSSLDRVTPGGTVTISWTGTNIQGQTTSCTVSGPGMTTQSPTVGTAPSCNLSTTNDSATATVSSQSTYTITCGTSSKSVTVNVIPSFQEF